MKRILSLAAGMMCLAQSALAQSPEDTVRWIYTSLTSNAPFSQQGLQALEAPAQRSTYFTRRMVAFYDANDSYEGDLAQACVDFGFSIPGQDFDAAEIVGTLRLSTQASGPNQTTVVADFTTFGQPARVIYDFAGEDGYWKIDDIAGAGFRVSQIPCTPKQASQTPAVAAGSYCFDTSADVLRLDVLPANRARLEFMSFQSNGHSCSGILNGEQVADGWVFHAEQGCRVEVRIAGDGGVVLADQDNVCKFMMCGQRALIDGLTFPHTSRMDCVNWRGISN